jgi:hypothetical protein
MDIKELIQLEQQAVNGTNTEKFIEECHKLRQKRNPHYTPINPTKKNK